jgi:ABC-type lipoprotein release transport system permease subunit
MTISVATRYAVRSVGRNLRRTLLSCIGVGVGCAIGLIAIGWVRGERELFVRAAAESGAGHLRVAPDGWVTRHEPTLRLTSGAQVLRDLRRLPGVAVATPRARAQALLALGTHVASVEVVGVDPETEPQALRFVRHVDEGRYLEASDREAMVLGRALAQRLHAELGDMLVVTAVGQGGEVRSAMLEIIGIAATGSRDIDLALCQVTVPELAALTGIGGYGEITLMLRDPSRLEAMRRAVAAVVPAGDAVLAWYDVSPELRAGVEIDAAWAKLTVAIVLFVVLLGVASAQLTAVLERRREFAVLSAVGMRGAVMVRLLLTEGLVLGSLGTLTALLLGTPVVWYLATAGVDLSGAMGEQGLVMSGVLIDPIFHADIGPWLVPYAVFLSLTATVLASVYPAWFAARTDPATALRVAQ